QGKDPVALIEERGLRQVSDESAIEALVDQVLAANDQMVQRYRNGEEKVLGALMGQVMKAAKGQASPQVAQKVLRAKLGS
ncbi:MAG TPA: Asp-tRNA(Asn)/Glu-tRNA(Gln) amidotransferase GatCAB subunit B, partial [Actinomycetota bacterium]